MAVAVSPLAGAGQTPAAHPKIDLRGVVKHFPKPNGEIYPALGPVSLAVPAGRFVAIVGPSGCGKSTLLHMVAGLSGPTAGEVWVDGTPVRGINRSVGFLFQDDALLPWRTVEDNIALGLKLRGLGKAETRGRVTDWIARVGLSGFAKHYPAQLSGGMRKRVAIAQTLIYEPDIILMDEPFAHLDAQARHIMQMDLLDLCAGGGRTILFVTHDLDEAIALADTIVVLSAGPNSRIRAIEDVGIERPRDLLAVRGQPRFGELSASLWRQLYEEVRGQYNSRMATARPGSVGVPPTGGRVLERAGRLRSRARLRHLRHPGRQRI
jgi:NitT/TauT family transport system ATP-binding protein